MMPHDVSFQGQNYVCILVESFLLCMGSHRPQLKQFPKVMNLGAVLLSQEVKKTSRSLCSSHQVLQVSVFLTAFWMLSTEGRRDQQLAALQKYWTILHVLHFVLLHVVNAKVNLRLQVKLDSMMAGDSEESTVFETCDQPFCQSIQHVHQSPLISRYLIV